MKESFDSISNAGDGERGSARLKFIITLLVVAVIAYMGFQYVPVAFQSYRFGKAIDESTDMASASGKSGEWLKEQIKTSAKDYSVPDNVNITEPIVRDGRIEVTVKFTRAINLLPFWTYNYNFDHTAKGNNSLNVH
jgi:hypothetical protein